MLFLFQGCLRLSFKKWTGLQDCKNTYLVNRFVSAPFFEKTFDSDLSILDYLKSEKSPDYFDIFPIFFPYVSVNHMF